MHVFALEQFSFVVGELVKNSLVRCFVAPGQPGPWQVLGRKHGTLMKR